MSGTEVAQEVFVGSMPALVVQLFDCSDADPENPPDTELDISSATNLRMHISDEDGNVVTETATIATTIGIGDGTDGYLEFLVPNTSYLDQLGTWARQGQVDIGGRTHKSQIVHFEVKAALA